LRTLRGVARAAFRKCRRTARGHGRRAHVRAHRHAAPGIAAFPVANERLDDFQRGTRLPLRPPAFEVGSKLRLHERLPALSPQQLLLLQTKVPSVHASDALLDYIQAVVKFTRESPTRVTSKL
jgi:MoxR-like ATPase